MFDNSTVNKCGLTLNNVSTEDGTYSGNYSNWGITFDSQTYYYSPTVSFYENNNESMLSICGFGKSPSDFEYIRIYATNTPVTQITPK